MLLYCRVTLLKVKETRKSKGVAFILFERPDDARKCVEYSNNTLVMVTLGICVS